VSPTAPSVAANRAGGALRSSVAGTILRANPEYELVPLERLAGDDLSDARTLALLTALRREVTPEQAGAARTEYQRAMRACLQGRGYSVR